MLEMSTRPHSLFEEQLPTIDGILARMIRKRCRSEEEAEEFRSFVYRKLLAEDCAALRKFRGRSSWKTFLTVVLNRLLLDFRDRRWGKWRPSVTARRRGEAGVLLARLVSRDGFGVEEALRILRQNHGIRVPAETLRRWATEVPRTGRPRAVAEESVEALPAAEGADAPLLAREHEARGDGIFRRLREILEALPAEQRLVVKMRYLDGLKVSEMARLLGRSQRRLYRECETILRRLRRSFLESGWDVREVAEYLEGS